MERLRKQWTTCVPDFPATVVVASRVQRGVCFVFLSVLLRGISYCTGRWRVCIARGRHTASFHGSCECVQRPGGARTTHTNIRCLGVVQCGNLCSPPYLRPVKAMEVHVRVPSLYTLALHDQLSVSASSRHRQYSVGRTLSLLSSVFSCVALLLCRP